jgi:hypothetical protein
MKKKIAITVLILLAIFFLWTSYLWKIFKTSIAGSYTHAETWTFYVKEDRLIKIINEIKEEHKELEPPNVTYPTSERNGFWYNFIFYYSDTNQDIQTWTRQNNDSLSTTFAFVAIMPHLDANKPYDNINGGRREINSDFNYWENRKEIKKFEDKIVKLIEEKIR